MYFDSWAALWYMDGHGIYVWTVYLVAAAVLTLQVAGPWRRARRFWRNEEALRKRLGGRPANRAQEGD
jgi:heme exporter protein D